ncbi:MAG: GreA/GreB family elongation factor [Verrucomicrobiota bacterium]|jgi:transcription elongation factor GreA-like protein/transcription elongation GreA/GreB family factor
MKEEFEKLAAAGKLTRQHVDALVELTDSGYCYHRSWGFGKIVTVDAVFSRFVIDFQSKPGHTMDLAFAAESLKPISSDHIYARKVADLDALRQMAALHHLDLIKLVLQSFGNRATVDQIQQVLVPDVIKDDWKKWWEGAKHELKKDGHFQVPAKKSDPILYQAKEVALPDRLMGEFRAAKGLKARGAVAHEILKNLSDIQDKAALAKEILPALNAEIVTHQRTQPAIALEAIFVRDELRDTFGVAPAPGEVSAPSLWLQESNRVGTILEQMPASKHRRALQSFKESSPERWAGALLASLNHVSAKLALEVAHALISGGNLEALKELLARLISQHQASSDLLLWLARERSDSFADILGPEVFRAMLTAMERDQFNEKRSNKLRDYVLDDPTLLVELIGSADLEVIKDLTRALQLSPCFNDMDKRSLLARIVKSYPAVQTMISGDQTRQENSFLVSWESLERRKNEYADLVQKAIPANSKEIALARSYGDLRENHEYKAAKEMQKMLMRRKGELESQLVRARGSDFANPRTDVVSIGTQVAVTDLEHQHAEHFVILGAWDSNPEKGIISYLTPVAQSLLNRKPLEEVEVSIDNARKRYRIDSIGPYQTEK